MKKFIAFFIMTACINCIYSQAELSFCSSVDQNGTCYFNNTKFISAHDSSTSMIYMQIKNKDKLSTGKVTFKIYTVDKSKGETLTKSLEQIIQPEWVFAWMPYTFNTPGKFNVKVYNEANTLLCSKNFELYDFNH